MACYSCSHRPTPSSGVRQIRYTSTCPGGCITMTSNGVRCSGGCNCGSYGGAGGGCGNCSGCRGCSSCNHCDNNWNKPQPV